MNEVSYVKFNSKNKEHLYKFGLGIYKYCSLCERYYEDVMTNEFPCYNYAHCSYCKANKESILYEKNTEMNNFLEDCKELISMSGAEGIEVLKEVHYNKGILTDYAIYDNDLVVYRTSSRRSLLLMLNRRIVINLKEVAR